MNTQAYIIRAISNLHAGSGDNDYGIIDKLVQRDPTTEYPTIYSTSLKGALREFFTFFWGKEDGRVSTIFGEGVDSSNQGAGTYDFDMGMLMSLPVRSNKAQFLSVTTPQTLGAISERLDLFGVPTREHFQGMLKPFIDITKEELTEHPMVFNRHIRDAIVEEYDFRAVDNKDLRSKAAQLEAYTGPNLCLVSEEHFSELHQQLPVIARNQLNNGKSENLWYEQIVPREARFLSLISATGESQLQADFDSQLTSHLVQIGGNATVGYGKCKFISIPQPPTP